MEGGDTHHVVGFERGSEYSEEDGRLSALISEHIHLLRKLLGDSLDTLYEEEFGNTFDAEEEYGGETGAEALQREARAKAKVLDERVNELRRALERKVEEKRELEKRFEKVEHEARISEHQYGTLCSDFAKNPDHRIKHKNLLDKFNELSTAVRQANETNDSLREKIDLREQVLRDADRINQIVRDSQDVEAEDLTRAETGISGHSVMGARVPYSRAKKGKPDEDAKQYFFLADSAATALEMERLRLMMRNVGERLRDAEEERQAVSEAHAMLNMELDQAESAKRKVLVEIALAQKENQATPSGTDAGNDKYLKIPDLDAIKAESDRQEAARMEALRAQLERRKKQREDALRKSKEWKASLLQEQEQRAKDARRMKVEDEEKQENLRRERQRREDDLQRYAEMEEDLKEKERKVQKLKELRIEELQMEVGRHREDMQGEDVLQAFVESLTPEKDLVTPDRERLASLSPDSDFTFPATAQKDFESFSAQVLSSVPSSAYQTAERASGGGVTPSSERRIEGIQTDLANRILSKTSQGVGSPSPSLIPSPTIEDGTQTPKRRLKVSPVTRLRVPKTLTKDEVESRLEEIEARRSQAFETLSTAEVHLIAEEELEEKVLRRRLKQIKRRERGAR